MAKEPDICNCTEDAGHMEIKFKKTESFYSFRHQGEEDWQWIRGD